MPRPPNRKSGGDPSVRRRHQAARKQRPEAPVPADEPDGGPVRLNKYLARAGVASRRDADSVIASGRVTINGDTVTEMGTKVSPDDLVAVDGRPVSPSGLVYLLLNKPPDVITTTSDDRGRRTVLDLLGPVGQTRGLFPVGRLDRHTTGALLLTTDGDLAHRLMHPRYETSKLYVVTTERPLTDAEIERLAEGVDLEDGPARADHAGRHPDDRRQVALQLHEGRNRQIRRMIEAIGHRVDALDRVRYAGLTLDKLRRGRWRRLERHEVNALRRSVKMKAVVGA
jgi:23S rRNA pseudouridine2605 synthase